MSLRVYSLAARGVYAQPYLTRGHREFYAVSSKGEHVAARFVREGADPTFVIDELWEELDLADPIATASRLTGGPRLQLVP